MAKELIWSHEGEYVYGHKAEFFSEVDFINTVMDEYDEGVCEVTDVKIEPCLYSERTLPGDHLIPLSLEEIIIENYYTAKVKQVI